MKRIFLLLLVCLALRYSYAQSNVRDSLNQLLQKESSDTGRVLLLNNLSYQYYLFKPDSAMLLALQGLELSRHISFSKGEATSLNNIGIAYATLGNQPQAMEVYLQALKIREKINDVEGIAGTFNNIGNIYRLQGEYRQAIEYFLKAKKLNEQLIKKESLAINLGNLARCLLGLKQYDSAKIFVQQAYAIASKFNYHRRTGPFLSLIGEIYSSETGQKKLALEYYRRSIPYLKLVGNDQNLGETFLGMATLFENEGQMDSTLFYANQALKIAQEKKFTKQFLNTSSYLSSFYKKRGKSDSAFFYLEVAKAANDSLFSQEKTKQLQSIGFVEKLSQKDLEAERNRYQNQIRLYILISALIVFLLIAIFLFRNNKQKQKVNHVLKQQKEKTEKAYEQLKATQSQLIQSEKMASLGELTAGIAHEIQNPLNFINNFSEVNKELLDEMKAELTKGNTDEAKDIADDVIQNMDKIHHHGKRADAIVKGMLQHSRASSGQKEPTDINALADEYLRLAYQGQRAKAPSFKVIITTDFDDSIGMIEVVPQDIGRVLLNLYNNAFYACTEQSRSAASLPSKASPDEPVGRGGYNKKNPTVWVTTKREDNKLVVSVRDNGPGILKIIRDKIFQPFFTTKPTGQGTGLGLSLSYDIIKAHGGELKVETKEGEGSEFIIIIPIGLLHNTVL